VGFQYFPAVDPVLMPYFTTQDEYGNTATRPGALFRVAPFEPIVQGAKYWLSEHGLRYTLEQTFTVVSMTDVKQGSDTLEFYSLNFKSKWAIFSAPDEGTAGWISSQVQAKTGFGLDTEKQSPKSNLGTVTQPVGIWSSVNGVRVPELAWQESVADGKAVVVAGIVSQGNYMDRNAYAQSSGNEFFNSAFCHSMVLPLPSYNFGLNLQWQPLPEWYGMFGSSLGDTVAGHSAWTDVNGDNWSLLWELGYAPTDVFGLGPGIYRAQPFVAQVGDFTGGGLCFDLQQKLGPHSPFGWFGRFGFGDSEVSSGASAQVGTGIAIQGPLKQLLLQRTSNDLLDVGFAWSQPSVSTKRVEHENEYVLETKYALQLTPTIKLQPDFQMVWNPAYNSKADQAAVFQLQIYLAW
jgi:carbohydrate-selective porin OprB